MTEKEDPYHLSGKPLPTTRIAPTNYTETAAGSHTYGPRAYIFLKRAGQQPKFGDSGLAFDP